MVRQICGLHAQVMSSAELTLWRALEDLNPTLSQEALWKERSLVRPGRCGVRVHLLPASELPIWVWAQRPQTPPPRPRAAVTSA